MRAARGARLLARECSQRGPRIGDDRRPLWVWGSDVQVGIVITAVVAGSGIYKDVLEWPFN